MSIASRSWLIKFSEDAQMTLAAAKSSIQSGDPRRRACAKDQMQIVSEMQLSIKWFDDYLSAKSRQTASDSRRKKR